MKMLNRQFFSFKVKGIEFNVFPVDAIIFILNLSMNTFLNIVDCKGLLYRSSRKIRHVKHPILNLNNIGLKKFPKFKNSERLRHIYLRSNNIENFNANRYRYKDQNNGITHY